MKSSKHAARLVLTLNAGSSSLKYALFETRNDARISHERVASGTLERATSDSSALDDILRIVDDHGGLSRLAAVGHRIVHGGQRFEHSEIVDDHVIAELKKLSTLDPDHMPAEISILEAMHARSPEVLQVACFDTAFHRTIPRVARIVPIPRAYESEGVIRYGFHGLSYTFLLGELKRVAGPEAMRGRVVIAHLGSGASVAAIKRGNCVDTTMGFTPTSGVPMATRSGDLDPGVLLYLLRSKKMSVDALDDLLNHHSGLVGISETSSDMRVLLASEEHDLRAAEAVATFCYAVKKAIGAFAAVLGGVDTLIFSGGIGENAAVIRSRIATGLEHLGIAIDDNRNLVGAPKISPDGAACVVRVMHTDEESVIARDTVRLLG
jgi:acetate kinase